MATAVRIPTQLRPLAGGASELSVEGDTVGDVLKQLYTMLGFMDDEKEATGPSVEQAIQLDPKLEPAQKDALIRVYRSFLEKG